MKWLKNHFSIHSIAVIAADAQIDPGIPVYLGLLSSLETTTSEVLPYYEYSFSIPLLRRKAMEGGFHRDGNLLKLLYFILELVAYLRRTAQVPDSHEFK